MTNFRILVSLFAPLLLQAASPPDAPIEIWHGAQQQVGRHGDPQPDFNVLGHVHDWGNLDTLSWQLNNGLPVPLAFRAYRRLARDGDFNADVPIALLKPGVNTITIQARFRDGTAERRDLTLRRETGSSPLPTVIRWADLEDPQDVGQYVDGRWHANTSGLSVEHPGYDRLFLIGDNTWQDYQVLTSFTIHEVERTTPAWSGPPGVGVILRFAGHVTGGPRHFPSGQPKWGYQPFGAIGWLRWQPRNRDADPWIQYLPGDSLRRTNHGSIPFSPGAKYRIRMEATTLSPPGGSPDRNVTRYQCRIWPAATTEPMDWSWVVVQSSDHALAFGGCALLAHHATVTFGDIQVVPLSSSQ